MSTAIPGPRERGEGALSGGAQVRGPRPRRVRHAMARGMVRLRWRRRIAVSLAAASFAAALGLGMLAYLGTAGVVARRGQPQQLLGALLASLVLAGIFALAAIRMSGPLAPKALGALYADLDDALDSARQVEAALRAQQHLATHQSATARQMMDEIRTMTDVAAALEHGVALLRDSTSQLFSAGAGASPARPMAVAASQIAGAAEQASALCQRLRVFTNQVIAEATTLGEGGQQAASHLTALLAALRKVEAALCGAGATSSSGAAGASTMQGTLARVSAPTESVSSAPRAAATGVPANPPGSARLAAPPRRSSWQHTGRTAPRLGRSGRPLTHPHLQGSDGLGASSSRPSSGGPRTAGNHPSTARHVNRPWYTDEPPAGAAGDLPARPESASHSTPRPNPGDWMR
jgi:hypothetical protein